MTSARFVEVSYTGIKDKVPDELSPQNNAAMPFATTPVFWVPVVSAQFLTGGADVKIIIDLCLDISDTGTNPIPGNTIGILPRNSSDDVQQLFRRLCVEDNADEICCISVLKDTSKKNAVVPAYIPKESTLRQIFETCVDLRSIPKKIFLKCLLEHTSNPVDKSFIENLCGRDSTNYTEWTTSGQASLIKILEKCPSCNPPVSLLLEHLPRLLPRPYSISYFSGKGRNMHVVFSILKSNDLREKTQGLCTGWLEEMTKKVHSKEDNIIEDIENISLEDKPSKATKIPIFFRKSNGFVLPEDPLRPLIMVGPGTGVAPFVGFLQQRQKLIDDIGKNGVGDSWLFFGCRYPRRDHLFQKEMQEYIKQGALTKYVVSYSRQSDDSRYVQDNILRYGKDVCDMLLEKNGIIYVCGDTATMGKNVKECIATEIAKAKNITKEEANTILKDLIAAKQYIEDLWS